ALAGGPAPRHRGADALGLCRAAPGTLARPQPARHPLARRRRRERAGLAADGPAMGARAARQMCRRGRGVLLQAVERPVPRHETPSRRPALPVDARSPASAAAVTRMTPPSYAA